MKKIILSLIISVSLILNVFSVSTFALTQGTSSIGVSGTLNPGKTISVKVTITAARGVVDNFNANVSYSAEHLQYIPANDNKSNSTAAGVVKILNDEGNSTTKSLTYTLSFKVLKVGTAEFKVYNIDANDGVNFIEVTGTSKKISITNPTKSSDNTLKRLKVGAGTLTPAFSPNVTEYKVTVPYDIDYFNIDAVKNHSGATVSYSSGDKGPNIKVGTTVRTVTVTAENGAVKKYNVTVTRLAQDATSSQTSSEVSSNTSSDTSSTPENDPLNVVVNGNELKVGEDLSQVKKPSGLELGEYKFNGINVPSFNNKSGTIIALYLIGEQGSGLYLYKPETDTFEPLCIIDSATQFIILSVNSFIQSDIVFDTEKIFSLSTVTVNGNEVAAYKYKDEKLSDFAVVCAQNAAGEMGYYTYDISEGTLQRYVSSGNSVATDSVNTSLFTFDTDTYVVLGCAALSLIAIVAIIIVWAVRRSRAKASLIYDSRDNEAVFDWENEVVGGDDFEEPIEDENDDGIDFEAFFNEQKNEEKDAIQADDSNITEENEQ